MVRSLRIEAPPDDPALIAGEHTLTYGELTARADELAAELGDVRGQRVLILAPNVPEFVIGLLACWQAEQANVGRIELSVRSGVLKSLAPITPSERGRFCSRSEISQSS